MIVLDQWRVLKLNTHSAFVNMAIDEAVLRAQIAGIAPNTLRLYRWRPSAVSIGKFQNLHEQASVEACMEHGFDVVRRITGGGAVYHDQAGEITYSVVASKKQLGSDIAAIYTKIYGGLIEALKILGITADFDAGDDRTCPNLTVKGKKISGSAQCHKKGSVLQHGTLLLDADLKRMFGVLRVPWAKTCMEVVNVAEGRLTSVKGELKREVSAEEAAEALEEGFRRTIGLELVEGELTPWERALSERLYRDKFCTEDWNLRGKETQDTPEL